jgi:hypothetical protein
MRLDEIMTEGLMFPNSIVMAVSRIERVVMLSLINLILNQVNRLISMQWISVFSLATNLVCIVSLQKASERIVTNRVVFGVKKVSLFIFTHALMRATVPFGNSWSQVLVQGIAVLSALCLIPDRFSKEEEGEQFASQVVYAYAINVEGLLRPFLNSRVFNVVAVFVIVSSAALRTSEINKTFLAKTMVLNYVLEAFDLIVFDSFTENAFIESGDHFCDLSVVFFVFVLLWNIQQQMNGISGIQQFTTWRVAQYVSDILQRYGLQDTALLLLSTVLVLLMSLQHVPHARWSQDLCLLIAIQSCVALVTVYLDSMGDLDGLPVLISVTVIITFVNDIVTNQVK